MTPSKITIFLPEGDPNGTRIAQIEMSVIKAIAFRRTQMRGLKENNPEIEHTGVYLLLGTNEDGDQIAYIGQSESVWARLAHYNANSNKNGAKDFWTDTIVLISKDESLTSSHARYIEACLIRKAKNNPRWQLPNVQHPSSQGKLPTHDRAPADQFVSQTVTLVGVLGCDLFREVITPSGGKIPTTSKNTSVADPDKNSIFTFNGGGFTAEMFISNSGQFVVTEGSRARLSTTNSIPKGTNALRASLLRQGVLKQENGALIFQENYDFPSVSSAAALIYGASANGRISWRLPDGRTYADWEQSQTADAD